MQDVVPVVVQVLLPGDEVTVYPVMVRPPLEAGGFHDTTDWPLANEVPLTPVGAPGLVGTSTAFDGADGGRWCRGRWWP